MSNTNQSEKRKVKVIEVYGSPKPIEIDPLIPIER